MSRALELAMHQQSPMLQLTKKKACRWNECEMACLSGSKWEVDRQRNWIRSSQETFGTTKCRIKQDIQWQRGVNQAYKRGF